MMLRLWYRSGICALLIQHLLGFHKYGMEQVLDDNANHLS